MATIVTTLRPSATLTSTDWASVGAATPHAATNETSPSDAQYAETYTADAELQMRLASGGTTQPDPDGSLVYTYRVKGDGVNPLTVRLQMGATVIASWVHSPGPADWTTFDRTLTEEQRLAVEAADDLRPVVKAGVY